jgi:hypothetical protein
MKAIAMHRQLVVTPARVCRGRVFVAGLNCPDRNILCTVGAIHRWAAVGADAFFTSQRSQVIVLASRHGWPAMYQWREFADAGGLARSVLAPGAA